MNDTITKAVIAAAAGGIVGWAGNALTLGGRVTAAEASLMRIEAKLDRVLTPVPMAKADQVEAK